MTLGAEDIRVIIERVAQQVMAAQREEEPGGILAVVPAYLFNSKQVFSFFDGKIVTYVLPDDMPAPAGSTVLRLESDRHKLIETLSGFEEVVLVTPPLTLLRSISEADDAVFAAALVLRPLLWGKKVSVLLDFEPPKYHRSTALAAVTEQISALEKAGFCIQMLPCSSQALEAKDLVTEQDIKDACLNGSMRVRIRPGAIVTQLAQDTAREAGVVIEY